MCIHETGQNKKKSSRNSGMLNSLNTLAVAPKIGILLKEQEVISAWVKETGQSVHHFLEETATAVWRTLKDEKLAQQYI